MPLAPKEGSYSCCNQSTHAPHHTHSAEEDAWGTDLYSEHEHEREQQQEEHPSSHHSSDIRRCTHPAPHHGEVVVDARGRFATPWEGEEGA